MHKCYLPVQNPPEKLNVLRTNKQILHVLPQFRIMHCTYTGVWPKAYMYSHLEIQPPQLKIKDAQLTALSMQTPAALLLFNAPKQITCQWILEIQVFTTVISDALISPSTSLNCVRTLSTNTIYNYVNDRVKLVWVSNTHCRDDHTLLGIQSELLQHKSSRIPRWL